MKTFGPAARISKFFRKGVIFPEKLIFTGFGGHLRRSRYSLELTYRHGESQH